MADPRTTLTDVTADGATSRITGTLTDETGAALGSASLTTFVMTLYALISGLPVINSRTAVNILNTGPGTIDANGAWTVTLTPADNDIVDTAAPAHEWHRLLLEWTYAAGVKAGKHEVDFVVRNLEKVT